MVLKLVVLLMAFVGMVSASGAGFRPVSGGEADGLDHAHGHGADDYDPDAGWRGFGKVVFGFAVVATIVIIAIVVLMFLSLGGVWEDDLADPPV